MCSVWYSFVVIIKNMAMQRKKKNMTEETKDNVVVNENTIPVDNNVEDSIFKTKEVDALLNKYGVKVRIRTVVTRDIETITPKDMPEETLQEFRVEMNKCLEGYAYEIKDTVMFKKVQTETVDVKIPDGKLPEEPCVSGDVPKEETTPTTDTVDTTTETV